MTEPIRGLEQIDDPTYRYQMTMMTVIKERTKVCVTNLDQIARDLRLPNKDPLVTYMSKILGAKTKVEKVKSTNDSCDRVIFAGNMSVQTISPTIYPFIDAFVLCPTCRLPELKYSAKKNALMGKCSACSFTGEITGDKNGSSTIKKFIQVLSGDSNGKKQSNTEKTEKMEKNNDQSEGKSRLDILLEREEKEKNTIMGFS